MKITSKQSILALLVGMTAGLLLTIFIRPVDLGAVIAVFAAVYLARASSLKEGALLGAIVLIPAGIYVTIQVAVLNRELEIFGLPVTILVSFITVLLVSGLGALIGLIFGKIFQVTKDHKLIL
jgi:hypothetical protein